MLLQRNFWYCVLRFLGFHLFLYNYIPACLTYNYIKPTRRQLLVFFKKPNFLALLWKNFSFSCYRRNALRVRLNLRDLSFLFKPYYQINWCVGFPAYMHLHICVQSSDSKYFEYGVAAVWIYTQAQLSNYIVTEYFKACGFYKTQNILALSLDYLFFRKI